MLEYDLRNHLVETAIERKVLSYLDVAGPLGLNMGSPEDRSALSNMLCEISVHEHNNGRPLLSVVVIGRENGVPSKIPGAGFYKMASDLGFEVSDKLMFFVEELNRVHAYWAKKK
ncbi:hypothetical protein FZ983_08715 [Azospirillum sp. B21]|uniref:hypothetical protein n=1 Tax=Azospirillum sp. B21 TaxID=2607496 RepID=UPI0011F04E01|nr:hypothetical protein [Azospirillum sp. B21]KAA0581022.1 hypothetical protein FZ983_08715 [Azospirillum sp. B21]